MPMTQTGAQGRGFQGDSRQGLGYGTATSTGRNEPRQSSSYFPYLDPDSYEPTEEDILDDETLDIFVRKVNGDYVSTDSERHKGNDPFYFVGANTKLVSCFLRADEILSEVEIVSHQLGLGGPLGSADPTITRAGGRVRTVPALGTGSKKGYFSPHPKPVETDLEVVLTPDELDQDPVWSLEDVPSDDERALLKIRNAIDSIHKEQELVDTYVKT